MESTLFTRLDEFMQYKGLNDNRITIQAKIAVGTLGKQRRSGKGLSYDTIVKILTAYPELNPTWFIMGTGDMLLKGAADTVNTMSNIITTIASQNAMLKKQQEKIDLLISQLDYMRTQVSINQEMLKELKQTR